SSHCPASRTRDAACWARSAAMPGPELSAMERSSPLSESNCLATRCCPWAACSCSWFLGFLEQVLALAPGLFRDPRGPLPGRIGHLLSGLNAAVTQASRLILNQLGRALVPAPTIHRAAAGRIRADS